MLFETLTSKNPREKDGGCCIEQMGRPGSCITRQGTAQSASVKLPRRPRIHTGSFSSITILKPQRRRRSGAQHGTMQVVVIAKEKTAISLATSWAHQNQTDKLAPEGTYIGRKGGVQAGPGSFDLSKMTSQEKIRVAQRESGVKSSSRGFIR